jgi:ASC-1-like (ASCH) protein
MKYILDLNDRPFMAIKAGTKKVEGRTLTEFDKTPYDKLHPGDLITFINNTSNDTLEVKVIFIHHYIDIKEMLEKEGVKNVLSYEPKTVDQGVKNYNSLEGYKEGIKKYGIYTMGIILL